MSVRYVGMPKITPLLVFNFILFLIVFAFVGRSITTLIAEDPMRGLGALTAVVVFIFVYLKVR